MCLLKGSIRLESAVGCLWVHCPDKKENIQNKSKTRKRGKGTRNGTRDWDSEGETGKGRHKKGKDGDGRESNTRRDSEP